jgi:hypothetical protein
MAIADPIVRPSDSVSAGSASLRSPSAGSVSRAPDAPEAAAARPAGPAPRLGRRRRARIALEPTRACAVCGAGEVAADEAFDGGLWLLAECGRCGHRWTAGPFAGPTPVPAVLRALPPEADGLAVA